MTPYGRFQTIKHRCYNSKDPRFGNYGGRGITICDRWLKNPVAFIKWAEKNGFATGLHLHRKNNNEGYSPDNCEFLTKSEHMKKHMAGGT